MSIVIKKGFRLLLVGLGLMIVWSPISIAGNWNKQEKEGVELFLYGFPPTDLPQSKVDSFYDTLRTLNIGENYFYPITADYKQYLGNAKPSEAIYLNTKKCPKPFWSPMDKLGDKTWISYIFDGIKTDGDLNLSINDTEYQLCFNVDKVDISKHQFHTERLRFYRYKCHPDMNEIASGTGIKFCLDRSVNFSPTSSSSKIDKAKATCTDLGFTAGTEKHGECVLKVMDN